MDSLNIEHNIEPTEFDRFSRRAVHTNLCQVEISILVDNRQSPFDSRTCLVQRHFHHVNLAIPFTVHIMYSQQTNAIEHDYEENLKNFGKNFKHFREI